MADTTPRDIMIFEGFTGGESPCLMESLASGATGNRDLLP